MASPRANWKGYIKFGEVSCPVALYTATSSSERIAFNTLNRKTGNRVSREFVDSETGETVERDDQVKGYEVEDGQYVIFEPEEVAAVVPESDKTLMIGSFIPCSQIDTTYFDKPYYLAPDKMGMEAFITLRDGMKKAKVAALATTVLFRRLRTVLIRPHGRGLIASTLNFDYEVRSAAEAFEDLPDLKIEGEMLELAEHIIGTKKGSFDASAFDDRYEEAVADLVKAKIEGRGLPKKKRAKAAKTVDLLQALRESAGFKPKGKTSKRKAANANSGGGRAKAAKSETKSKSSKAPSRRAG
ncbi:Ku protein [Peteryoungia ipomoeae]|uniref:Non-homologous end joining protein Ku n=1 Tax=Peteryoungia ipomoeae TaxID=1210932 RepID=A0A4V4HM66_9HYPH|nr:Ku protein [Peteryoungia ipomoeae]THV20916.1 Ku protein [Peteryoungia ipomoeae]